VEVAVHPPQPLGAIAQSPPPREASLLDATQPRCIDAGHRRRIAIDEPEDSFAMAEKIADRAPVRARMRARRGVDLGEERRQGLGARDVQRRRCAALRDRTQVVGVERAFAVLGHEVELARVAERHQRAVAVADRADVEGGDVTRDTPERIPGEQHLLRAIGAAIVAEVVAPRGVEHDLACATVGEREPDAQRSTVADALRAFAGGACVVAEHDHAFDARAREERVDASA
jgi:hypothetical protein